MNHDRIEELLAVRALGGLDGSDVAALERERSQHGDCAECRRLEYEFSETAAMLADVLTPEPVSPGMVDAIIATAPPSLVAVPDAAEPSREEPETVPFEHRRRSSWRTALALAAAFVLVMVGGALTSNLRGSVPVSSAALTQQMLSFQGAKGSLEVAYTPGEAGAVFFGSGLPKPGKNQVYEIWTISGNQPISAGCASSKDGTLHTSVSTNVGDYELLAITIEPAACPAAPSGTPILTTPVSA